MSNYNILIASVVGLAVLVIIRALFLNPASMERLAHKAGKQGVAKRIIPLIGAIVVAEVCFALMFVMLCINPIYSFLITGGVLVVGLAVVAIRRLR
jgi:hypothetical protein